MVRQIVAVLVLQRLDRAFRVDCHVKLIGVSLEEGGVTSP